MPNRQTLAVDVDAWAVASPLRFRICNGADWYFDMNLDAAHSQLDWAMKSRYNTMGPDPKVCHAARSI